MPLYEYQCPKCERFEIIRKFSDSPLAACPTCGSEVQKLPSAPAIQFKGSGWYVTDYARKPGDGATAAKEAPAPKGKDASAASTETGATSSGTAASSSAKGNSASGGSPSK